MNNYIVSLRVKSEDDEKATKFAQFLIDTLNVYQKEGSDVSDVQIALTKVQDAPDGE